MPSPKEQKEQAAGAALPRLGSREQFIGIQDARYEDVPVPSWGVTVRLRGLSGAARGRVETASRSRGKAGDPLWRERLLIECIVKEDGTPMFTEKDLPDVAQKLSGAIEMLAEHAARLSGLGDEAVEAAASFTDPTTTPTG